MVGTEVQWQEAVLAASALEGRPELGHLPGCHMQHLNKPWSESQYGIWREACLGVSVGSAHS